MGDLSMECRRVGILVGYRGTGEMIIPLFHKESLDLVIYGEGPEWEALNMLETQLGKAIIRL